ENVARFAAKPGSLIVGAIAASRPEDPGFPDYLERQKSNSLVKGFRRVLHVMPDGLSETPLFRDNLKRLSGTCFTFDLCVLPRLLTKANVHVERARGVQFGPGRFGHPQSQAGECHPWRGMMRVFARRPNVAGQISGDVAYADPASRTVETLRPWVEHSIDVF